VGYFNVLALPPLAFLIIFFIENPLTLTSPAFLVKFSRSFPDSHDERRHRPGDSYPGCPPVRPSGRSWLLAPARPAARGSTMRRRRRRLPPAPRFVPRLPIHGYWRSAARLIFPPRHPLHRRWEIAVAGDGCRHWEIARVDYCLCCASVMLTEVHFQWDCERFMYVSHQFL
jgi:hypothetical protein